MASRLSDLVMLINLCQILFALVGAFAVDFALVKWREELYKPELPQAFRNAIEQLKGGRHGRRIERFVLELLRAKRLHLDPKFLASAWAFAVTSFAFAALIFVTATFNLVWHLLIDTCLSLMAGFQCITMFLATAALMFAASCELFNIRQGRVYPSALNKRWSTITAMAGPNWPSEIGEDLYKALEVQDSAKRRSDLC